MQKTVSIIGGGTAALFFASFIDTAKYEVTIYEQKSTLGRKFLVAGDGGFNITHSESISVLKTKYTPSNFLDTALSYFTNEAFRAWMHLIGILTYVGSSGRVFPERGVKPIEVLKAIEMYLINKRVKFQFGKTFIGWDLQNNLLFKNERPVKSDFTVFSLGGASWKVTGSDGLWMRIFNEKGIETVPFTPSNCAYKIEWNKGFIEKNEGKPLKNISISIGKQVQKGEAVLTKFGIEGNAIYGLSPEIKTLLAADKEAIVFVDFKSTYDLAEIVQKLAASKANISSTLRAEINLPKVVIELLKCTLSKEDFMNNQTLATFIKSFPLSIKDSAQIDESISTAGGVSLNNVTSNFELKVIKNQFCIGEMLDWDAPTGGYLIQACASMGAYLGHYLNEMDTQSEV